MINHSRTLLLNRQSSYFDNTTGNVYIPPNFYPVRMTNDFKAFRNVLIPSGIDPSSENYIANALVRILHMPELNSYSIMFDTRLTYDMAEVGLSTFCDGPISIDNYISGSDVTTSYGVKSANYPSVLSNSGRHIWTAIRHSNTQIRLSYNRGPERIVNVIDPAHATRSINIWLIPNYLYIYFDMPTGVLTDVFKFTYTVDIAVPYNLADVFNSLSTLTNGFKLASSFFYGSNQYANELDQLATVWTNSPEMVLRFGSIMSAYLIRLEILRMKQNGRTG